MTNWRAVLNAPDGSNLFTHTHNPQNPQIDPVKGDSEDFEQYGDSSNTSKEVTSPAIPQRAPEATGTVLSVSASSGAPHKNAADIQPGDSITWEINGHHGGPAQVDFVHHDEDGTTWVYVSRKGWQSAVNSKVVTKVVVV